jgi:glucose/arabinose dehydrogenase
MLVIQNGKGITVHTMTADGCISATKTLVAANNLNHGIVLSLDGKTLYASTSTTVYSWPYTASSQTVGTRGTVVTGMYNGGSHTSRTLLIAPHQPNLLIVSHGSNANFDTAAGNKATARAIIKVFDLSTAPSAGYNYVSQGYNAGYGLRNEVGIVFDGNNMYVSHFPELVESNKAVGFGGLKTVGMTLNVRSTDKPKTSTLITLLRNSTILGT